MEKQVHCFILVDIFYIHLQYQKNNTPIIKEDMNREDITKEAKQFQAMEQSCILEVFCKVEDNNRERVTTFTMLFETHWRTCTDGFLDEGRRCIHWGQRGLTWWAH